MSQRVSFIAAALACVGTRYRHQGRLPGVALDCAGLVVCAAWAAGMDVKDMAGYARTPDGDSLLNHVRAQADVVHGEPQPGDVLVFAWDRDPQHLALCTAPGRMVHAYASVRRVVEHDIDEWWSRLRVECLRPRFID